MEIDGFGRSVRSHQLQGRGTIADQIATRSQRVSADVLLRERDEAESGDKSASCVVPLIAPEAQAAQTGQRDDGPVLGIRTGNTERLNRGGDVAVVDLGRTHLLRARSRFLLIGAPTRPALEHVHLPENAQRIDAASGALSRRPRFHLAGARVPDFVDRGIDTHDLRHERTRELRAQPAALALAVPGAEQQRRRRELQQRGGVGRLRRRQTPARRALHEGFVAHEAVAQDGVVDAVRRVEGRDALQRIEAGGPKVDRHVRDPDLTALGSRQQRFFQSVRLALNAVDEHAPDVAAVDAPPLEHVPGRCVPSGARRGRIGRREELVPSPTDRLEALDAPKGGVAGDGLGQRRDGHVHASFSVSARELGASCG